MLERLKKHSVKILVFVINLLLAAITIFAIQEKDQNRLLKNAENERKNENVATDNVSSFENSVNIKEQEKANDAENNVGQKDTPIKTSPADNTIIVPVTPPPADPAPAPTKKTKPSNAKTKTS